MMPFTEKFGGALEREVREANESGYKVDAGKLRFDLLPPDALMEIVRVYTFGSTKYPPRNMERGMSWGRVFAALMRHAWAFWAGEDLDRESGLPHLAHLGWCALTLLDYMKRHREFDDRSTETKIKQGKGVG